MSSDSPNALSANPGTASQAGSTSADFIKLALILLAIHIFVTLAQTPVTMIMAKNAGRELCAMARRGELESWKWPEQLHGVANNSRSLPDELRQSASLLAESCSVRVYPTTSEFGTVVLHIRPEEARRRAMLDVRAQRAWNVGRSEGHWIALRYHLLWTPLFDLLRSVPYAGRIEIIGFGSRQWGVSASNWSILMSLFRADLIDDTHFGATVR